jgi:hypothetical protein
MAPRRSAFVASTNKLRKSMTSVVLPTNSSFDVAASKEQNNSSLGHYFCSGWRCHGAKMPRAAVSNRVMMPTEDKWLMPIHRMNEIPILFVGRQIDIDINNVDQCRFARREMRCKNVLWSGRR